MKKPCEICGTIDKDTVSEGLCDGCWYGMRLEPEAWIKELAAKGIHVDKTGGCEIRGRGTVILCTNPYSRMTR